MGIYKTAKTAPIPLAETVITSAQTRALRILHRLKDKGSDETKGSDKDKGADKDKDDVLPSQGVDWDRNVWSDEDCAVEMLLCMVEAVQLSQSSSTTAHSSASNGGSNGDSAATAGDQPQGSGASLSLLGKMVFDKDDLLAMRFVCAAANMRCRIFGIPAQVGELLIYYILSFTYNKRDEKIFSRS